jgi:hypothetical protein
MTCFRERNYLTIHVDSTLGPTLDMNFLEQEASTKFYNGSNISRLKLCFWILILQFQHSLSNVCVDDILQGIFDKVVFEKMNPNVLNTRVEAKTAFTKVGFNYKVYDVCPCNKTLYYGKCNYRVHPPSRASSPCVYSQCAVHAVVGPCANGHFIHAGTPWTRSSSSSSFSFLSHGRRSYDVVQYCFFYKNTLEYPFIVLVYR